jgi:ketosteroid isomerase-like protein
VSDEATIVHEIETSYAAYAGAFNDENIDGVVRYISAPYVMTIGANAPMVMDSPEHVRGLFERSLAGMKGRGWAKSDFKTVHIWPLSNDHALLMTDIIRYKADGSVLETGRYIYSVRRAAPSWQITGVTDVPPPFMGPGDFARPA